MKIVYFNPELSARAPDLLGVFCLDPSGQWLTLKDIDDALAGGADVEIRQASETEVERAEAVAVLYEIELQLARQVGGLLDPGATATDNVAAMVASAFTAGITEPLCEPLLAVPPPVIGVTRAVTPLHLNED
ncbi:hypothetical protein BZG29_18430 [Janthinobacterium sp. LM6]|uniref:hypothetical protein n=1 Tax=Janthinobacterium sp. LM6 TaxID=1938606 RepID=UPI000983AA2C|nr:hypothetical protein [Janthinobacterium sp. LM6]AQR70083.1 hypothetical protein BZG29_18430 [Janthinobacterium sp. LM6]